MMSVEQAQEYGTVDGPWLVLLLQVANKGAAEAFAQLIFGKQ